MGRPLGYRRPAYTLDRRGARAYPAPQKGAVHVAKVLTPEREEEYVDEDRRRGGFARAESLTSERPRELARKASARWSKENK